jgi:hypothetical protein
LDFGANAFPGGNRYLEIRVRRKSLEPFTTLSPRQEISATPYAIRALSAAQADLALDSNKLGGIDASQYATTTSIGVFHQEFDGSANGRDLNIDGNGTIGGTFQAGAPARKPRGVYGLTHTDGMTTVGTYVGGTIGREAGGLAPTNDKLFFFTNNGQPTMTVDTTGNVGRHHHTASHIDVAGNAVQDRDKGGMVAAMLYVDGTFNSQHNAAITEVRARQLETADSQSVESARAYEVSFDFRSPTVLSSPQN